MATRPLPYTPTASQDISRPYFTQKVKLNSLHAHQVFDRGFELCANAIFSLSIVLRVFATDAQAREVETIVDNRLNKVFEDIRTEGIRLEKLAESNGIEFSGVTYSKPKELEAQITSPRAVRYIGLIREFDSLVAKFDRTETIPAACMNGSAASCALPGAFAVWPVERASPPERTLPVWPRLIQHTRPLP
jgi:hypothetical protein